MKKLVLFCMALLLCACAKQPPLPGAPEGEDASILARRWQAYTDTGAVAQAPYRLQMSLRFGEEGNTRRVTALLWGNGGRELRLDVMAGVGTVVAKILEDGQHFLVYAPLENKAYFHQGAASPLLRVGVPVPFGLSRLTALLTGHYSAAFGDSHAGSSLLPDGLARYALEGTPGGRLDLDAAGRPVAWRETAADGWRMEIVYDDGPPPLPRRLNLTHGSGKRALLLVKEREHPGTPFTPEQMRLTLPEGAPLLPLSQYRAHNS